ncbi:serine hydrolase domain-containing protein [Falsibacillus albus]|uniref:Class C beta-lactamase-related serine hydrolase n=1 Tax=Falsibacillus albus TaxID=2478915 RepID=A0A3L7JNB7_9BACI|nr:serine hydrolase [Falsibacillus albus]RLQ92317.1 class C beta-lactamase-related serine hydrolase [Falsibacillus albus]
MKKNKIPLLLLVVFFIFSAVSACSNETSKDQETRAEKSQKGNGDETDESALGIPEKANKIESYWPTNGWQKTKPESVGMDSAQLKEMFKHIETKNIPMEGFLVIKDGYIVAEKYGGIYSENTPHPIYSVTKSLTSAMVGVAMKQGAIKSVDDPVLSYLDKGRIANLTDWKKQLTIKSFLTMKSGLDFPEQTERGFYDSETWKQFMDGDDPAYFILNRPVRNEPDGWNYSTGDARVVSKIIQTAVNEKLSDYAKQQLFDPMGISNVEWPSDQSGTSFGGTGVKMTPRDLAKIGYLYLNNGKWEDQQLLPQGWVAESTMPYGDTNGNFDGSKYGYFFWLKKVNGYDTYRAMGLYGQYMVVVPKLNLIVVQTSNGMDVDPLLEKYIIPSIK